MVSQGQQQTVMFCGDGLNDLAALGTAEVGMAIGPIDAMAAAPFSTKRSSIAGCPVKQLPMSSGQSLMTLALVECHAHMNMKQCRSCWNAQSLPSQWVQIKQQSSCDRAACICRAGQSIQTHVLLSQCLAYLTHVGGLLMVHTVSCTR